MGTKNNPGAWDCYANAEPDEPMFILLGRDASAPYVVAFWAMIREKTHPDEPVKIQDAKDCAKAMAAWAKGRGKDFEALEPVVDDVVDVRLRDLRERVRVAEASAERWRKNKLVAAISGAFAAVEAETRAEERERCALIVEEYAEDVEALDDAENVRVMTGPKQIRELVAALRKQVE